MGSGGLPVTGVELVAQNLQGFVDTLNKGNQAVSGFGKDMETQAGQTSKMSDVMVGALRRVGELAVDVMLKAGQALIGFGQDSLRLAGDFDQGMQQFKVAAGNGLDTKGIEQFHDLFLQLGKDLPVSTAEVQQAAIEMVKGGLDPAILAAGGLKQNINFAAAAMGGDLAGAATISAKIVAGWADVNATAADKSALLTHATDLLTKAANASSVDVHELSLGLFNVQATAKNAGIGLDDVTTVLAELSGDFASSSEAGNSLASFITRLHPTTKAATEAMESLGLVTKDGGNAFYDAQGNFVGFQKASEILKTSLKGLNNEQKQQIMQTIFQKDAMGVAAGLASRGAQGYDAMADSLQNAMGVAEAGTTVQEGYNTAVQNAEGGLEALKITIGEKMLPIATEFYNFLNDKVLSVLIDLTSAIFGDDAAFAKLSPTLQGVVSTIDVLVSDVQEIIGSFQTAGAGTEDFATKIGDLATDLGLPREPIEIVTKAIQDLSTHGQDLVDILTAAEPTVVAIGAAFASFTIISSVAGWVAGLATSWGALTAGLAAAEGPLAAVVALLGGPVTVTIGAIALAVGVLTLAWQNNWGDIQGKTAAVWNYLKPIFDEVVEWLQTNIPKAVAAASDFWTNTLWPALQKVGTFIKESVFPILDTLANVWLKAAEVEVKLLASLWADTLWPALKKAWSFIQDDVVPIFKALFDVEFAIAKKAVEALAGLWEKVLYPGIQKVGNYINDTVIPVFKDIGSYLNTTFGPSLKDINDWLTKVTGGFGGVTGAVKNVVDWLENLAGSIGKLKLPSWLTPGSPTPWEIALYGIGKALTTSVTPGLSNMQQGMADIGAQIKDTFENSDIVDTLTNLGQDAMAGFGQGLRAGMRGVESVINSTANTVEDAFNNAFDSHSPSKRMEPIGEFVSQGFLRGIQNMWPQVTSLMLDLGDDLIAEAEDMAKQVQDAISSAFGATASIDRQKVSNMKNLGNLDEPQQASVQQQLDVAEQIAMAMNDPKQAQDYFKMRSQQIFELANIQEQLNAGLNSDQVKSYQDQIAMLQDNSKDVDEAAKQGIITQQEADRIKEDNAKRIASMQEQIQNSLTAKQRADLEAQLALIQAAQQAEQQQFNASLQQGGGIKDLIDQINKLMMDTGMGIINSPALAQLSGLLDQLQNASTIGQPAGYSPPMMASQYSLSGGISTTNSQTSYNMPIYTNNSPAALQQSFALLRATTMR